MLFTGKHPFTIDAKHRLAIPAKIRAMLDPHRVGTAFYITLGVNNALWLWPPRTFERMAGHIEATLAPAPALMDVDEITFPEAERLELDAAGRVRVPEEMLAAAGLGTRVVVIGMRNHLEIWDPDRWQKYVEKKTAMRAEIAQRARPLLGRYTPPPGEADG